MALVLALCLSPVAMAEDYTATAKGFGGDVTVTLTIEDGKLTAVKAEGPDETEGIGSKALEELPEAMVARNSVEVDTVASATVTSTAVLTAAADALAQAGVTLEPVEGQGACQAHLRESRCDRHRRWLLRHERRPGSGHQWRQGVPH